MKRMRDRLNLTSNVYTQNHTVRKAMEQLRDIGYLDYTELNVAEPPISACIIATPNSSVVL